MVAEEKYVFKSETKKKLVYLAVAGIVLFVLGLVLAMQQGGSHGEEHASAGIPSAMVASADASVAVDQEAGGEHHESPAWLKRTYASLWQNNIIFIGFGLIGLFFVAIQYAASAGWAVPVERVALAMGAWIPVAGVLTLIIWFVAKGTLFHWSHHNLYVGEEADPFLMGRSAYFFWPLEAGGFPFFFVARMVVFFALWYMFFIWIRREMLAEDLDGSTAHWFKARKLSAGFLVVFAFSSSIAAWDWVMSIDSHWFSTMIGWYTFASWWVSGLAMITLLVVALKEAGYLKTANANHLHALGKFVFAFSIFWTYIWFGQFLLIWYANIPEETVYFYNQMRHSPYSWIFYTNLILNFVLPFLLFITRDSKRHISMLKVVCAIVVIGQWFNFYIMVTPGVAQHDGQVGFIEIGLTLVFMAAFFFVVLNALSRMPLVGRNHPMMGESLNHHS